MTFEGLELSGLATPINAFESDEANHELSIKDGTRNRNCRERLWETAGTLLYLALAFSQ
jgi:hypothetical protein